MNHPPTWFFRIASALAVTITIATAFACKIPNAPSQSAVLPPTITPLPTPTWTPIPIATATPQPTNVLVPGAPPDPHSPVNRQRSKTPTGELIRYSEAELFARRPAAAELGNHLGLPVTYGTDKNIRAIQLGLDGQFIEPVIIRRLEPALLALIFLGQATSRAEQQIADALLANPGIYLNTIATDLVKAVENSASAPEVLQLVDGPPPHLGKRSSTVLARISSGADIFEAHLLVVEHESLLILMLQITNTNQTEPAHMLDDSAIVQTILNTEIPRG